MSELLNLKFLFYIKSPIWRSLPSYKKRVWQTGFFSRFADCSVQFLYVWHMICKSPLWWGPLLTWNSHWSPVFPLWIHVTANTAQEGFFLTCWDSGVKNMCSQYKTEMYVSASECYLWAVTCQCWILHLFQFWFLFWKDQIHQNQDRLLIPLFRCSTRMCARTRIIYFIRWYYLKRFNDTQLHLFLKPV